MASDSKSSSKPKTPNFYDAAAEMGGGKSGTPPAKAAEGAGGMSEKVSNVQALLEVFKKMDKLEQDADAKSLIQQMSDIAQQYLTKVQKPGADKGTSPATGAGATPAPPPVPPEAAAGAGAGAGSGAPASMMGA